MSAKPYDYDKSVYEQLPDFQTGNAAEVYLKQCEEAGIQVININDIGLDSLAVLKEHNEKIPGKNAGTNEFWRNIVKNTKQLIDEDRKNLIDFSQYSDNQIIVIQRLRNTGFELIQINALMELIKKGYSYDNLIKYFNKNMVQEETNMINTERILNASKNMVIATSYTTSLTKLKTVAIAIVAAAGGVVLIYGGVKFAESFQKKDQNGEYSAIYTIAAGGIMVGISALVAALS